MPCWRCRTKPFLGLKFTGRSFDCGGKIGFLAANFANGLARHDNAAELKVEIERLLGEK